MKACEHLIGHKQRYMRLRPNAHPSPISVAGHFLTNPARWVGYVGAVDAAHRQYHEAPSVVEYPPLAISRAGLILQRHLSSGERCSHMETGK